MTYPGRAMERAGRKLLLADILMEQGRINEAARQIRQAGDLFTDIGLAEHPTLDLVRSMGRKLLTYQE